MFPELRQRERQAELMDDPALAADRHVESLRGLARINVLSRSASSYWRALQPLRGRPLRLLDLACGGGDVLIGLWRRARKAGWPLTCVGVDRSETAVTAAQRNAAAAGAGATNEFLRIDFLRLDALHDEWPAGFDVVSCSLFLHHLADDEAVHLLRRMAAAAGVMLLVNDLRRSRAGLLLAGLAPRLLTRSPIVHVDAVRSVRAAFTPDELRSLAALAGLPDAHIAPRWPQRMLLTWRRT